MSSKIIFGFPGVGKTWCYEHQEELGLTIQDSDSSKFHWLLDDDDKPMLDPVGEKIIHPAWPANYAQYVALTGWKQEINPDVIMISTHAEVVDAIMATGIDHTYMVMPVKEDKEYWMNLYKERGSDDAFLSLMNKRFDLFVDSCWEMIRKYPDRINAMVISPRSKKLTNMAGVLNMLTKIPVEFDKKEG